MNSPAATGSTRTPPRPPILRITAASLDFVREPLAKPLGFKGSAFTEKWVCRVALTSESGASAVSHGGLAVLWSDARVFLSHSETGANVLMAAVVEFALQCARRHSFATPLELHEKIFPEVHAYACDVTRLRDLNPTFTLNALVSVDQAAWLLHARERSLRTFDELVPDDFRAALPERHRALGCIPLISYNTGAEEIAQLARDGHFLLKIKIGAPGDEREMLAADQRRLAAVHDVVCSLSTEHTVDGRLRYYVDANGRYRTREQVEQLLDFADRRGFLERIALFEEPFEDPTGADLRGLPVMFAADESLHDPADIAARLESGFRAVALKPAGKGFSVSLRFAREAQRLGAVCFVADSACTPLMLDWNKNVAARLPALPGTKIGLLEVNGPQSYGHWAELLQRHPAAGRPWHEPHRATFTLDEDFYTSGGGIL